MTLAVVWLIALAEIDRRTMLLPNALVLPALAGAVVTGVLVPSAGLAGLLAAAPYLVAFVAGTCGGGDVKLAAVCGVLLGDPALALLVVLGAALVSLGQVVIRQAGPCGPAGPAAHGPALVAVTLAGLVAAGW